MCASKTNMVACTVRTTYPGIFTVDEDSACLASISKCCPIRHPLLSLYVNFRIPLIEWWKCLLSCCCMLPDIWWPEYAPLYKLEQSCLCTNRSSSFNWSQSSMNDVGSSKIDRSVATSLDIVPQTAQVVFLPHPGWECHDNFLLLLRLTHNCSTPSSCNSCQIELRQQALPHHCPLCAQIVMHVPVQHHVWGGAWFKYLFCMITGVEEFYITVLVAYNILYLRRENK